MALYLDKVDSGVIKLFFFPSQFTMERETELIFLATNGVVSFDSFLEK